MTIYSYDNEGNLLKYNVTFDREEVSRLKKEIIENCSLRKFEIVKNVVNANIEKPYRKIISKRKIGMKMGKQTEEDLPLYEIKYYDIEYPQLVKLIDRLLRGDKYVLSDIMNYKDDRKLPQDILNSISKELSLISDFDYDKKISKLNELKNASEYLKDNENVEKTDKYLVKLISLIRYELVDTLSKEELSRYNEFFNGEVNHYSKRLIV